MNSCLTFIFCFLCLFTVSAQEGKPMEQLAKPEKMETPEEREEFTKDIYSRITRLEKNLSDIKMEINNKDMEKTEGYRNALDKVEVKKNELKDKLERYTEASDENIETLKRESEKAFEELKKQYQVLIDELTKDDRI